MSPHPRVRTTIKWGGATLTLILTTAWFASGWFCISFQPYFRRNIGVNHGCLYVSLLPPLEPAPTLPQWRLDQIWHIGTRWTYTPRIYHFPDAMMLPIWPLIMICAAVTAIAWRLDTLARRRARLAHCRHCGYSRAGLAGGAACPECGRAPE